MRAHFGEFTRTAYASAVLDCWGTLPSAVVAVRIAVTASDRAGRPSAVLTREWYER
jgi:hypothetical protein